MGIWTYGQAEQDELLALEAALQPNHNVAAPFVPYVGPEFGTQRARSAAGVAVIRSPAGLAPVMRR